MFYFFSLAFLLTHSLLLVGLGLHLLRGIYLPQEKTSDHIERWVWFLYPLGLVFILVTHILIGLLLQPKVSEIELFEWIFGFFNVLVSAVVLFLLRRYYGETIGQFEGAKESPFTRLFSLNWLYLLLWRLFRLMARVTSLISTILEGDGGILWALVLFALIFVFLQR